MTSPSHALTRYLCVALPVRLADEGARVALVLLAVERAHSTAVGGLLVAALMVPHVMAAPVVGALADTVRRRTPLYGVALLVYGVCLAGPALTLGWLPVWCAVVLMVVAGSCAPLLTGGLTGLLSEILQPERLARGFSVDSTSYNLAGICGPALAAVLASTLGSQGAVLGLGLAACLAAAFVPALRLPRRAPADSGDASGARNSYGGRALLLSGARALTAVPRLRSVTWSSSIAQIGVGALPLICALIASREHSGWAAGGLMTVFALGALTGSLTYAVHPWTAASPHRVVLACVAGGAPFLLTAAFQTTLLPLALCFAAAGWTTGPLFSALLAAREQNAPPEVRTQVFTLGAGLKSTAAAAGSAAAGAAGNLGIGLLLTSVAALHATAAVIGVLLLHQRHPDATALDDREGEAIREDAL